MFTLFPKLPPELRLSIWEFLVPVRQTFKVTSCLCKTFCEGKERPQTDQTSLPGIIHASRESRAVALKRHHLAFGSRFGRAIYFDYDQDTLKFVNEDALINFTQWAEHLTETAKAEDVVKRIYVETEFQGFPRPFYHHMAQYSALETLIVEYKDSRKHYQSLSDDSVMQHFKERWAAHTRERYRGKLWPSKTFFLFNGRYFQMADIIEVSSSSQV